MEFNCKLCNKKYKSNRSLWNHKNKFHKETNNDNNDVLSNVKCNFCKKVFQNRSNKLRHEQKCKLEYAKKKEEEEAKELEKKKLELKLAKEQAKILKLKIKLQNSDQVDNPTIKKINDLLIKYRENIQNSYNSNSTINSHNNNSNNNINIVNNIFQIKQLGNENIPETLTFAEKREIIYDENSAFKKFLETVYCGKYPQFKNVIVIDKKEDPSLYNFNEETGIFNKIANKNGILDNIVTDRVNDLRTIYDDFNKKNYINNDYQRKNGYFFDDIKKKTHKNVQIKNVKNMLFDNHEKTTNELIHILSQKNQEIEKQITENLVVENHDIENYEIEIDGL